MPRALYATAPGTAELREHQEKPLEATQLRVRMDLSAEKHGTTIPDFAGERDGGGRRFDRDLRVFVDADGDGGDRFPTRLGNMGVGTVVEAGDDVESYEVGDRIFGYLPIGETAVVSEDGRIWPALEGVEDDLLVCTDPATVGLMAARYGHFSLGDRVAVFGLGAIGLFTVQASLHAGADPVIAIDPIAERRELAERYGAHQTLDPADLDVGRSLKERTDGEGVDAALDTSGSYEALHQAIRGTAYGGNVVPVSFYHDDPEPLDLSEEWHFNRQTMISGARVESEPYHGHPRWDRDRVYETVFRFFERGRLTADGMLSPVPLAEAPAAYERLAEDPTDCVKLAVTY